MRTHLLISALAAPFLFAACNSDKPAAEQMGAGADKVAEGVKEMASATGEMASDAAESTKEKMGELGEKVSDASQDAKDKIHEKTAPE